MTDSQPAGFSLDIDDILKELKPKRRTTRRRTSSSTSDMDAAVRRAVRAELVDVERALKALVAEVVKLRKANDALAVKVGKLSR
jgi:hypothetical protein